MIRKIRFSLSLLIVAVLAGCVAEVAAAVPQESVRYQRDLTREARAAWGLGAPIATFAGQIHQESHWRADAHSKYAAGLAQFTPDTTRWIAGAYPATLASGDALNPQWAMRALVVYDQRLWAGLSAASACDRMAMALAGYNGGPGWITREQRATVAAGGDGKRWFDQVENHCLRSAESCRENRSYPRLILLKHQLLYAAWGAGVPCPTA